MEKIQLGIFIQSIIDYFSKMTDSPAEAGVPFLKSEERTILKTYTGVIGISGKLKGAIYFTADKDFLSTLLDNIMPGIEKTDQTLSDISGEIANTIAGNAQETLGKDFHISVPIIFTKAQPEGSSSLKIQAATFVIPLLWKGYEAALVVGIEKEGI